MGSDPAALAGSAAMKVEAAVPQEESEEDDINFPGMDGMIG